MKFIGNWMFKPLPPKEMEVDEIVIEKANVVKEADVKEIPPSPKERLIVHFIYFLMGISTLSLLTYLLMLILKIQGKGDVLNVFFFTLSPLIGYFLGTNKERGS